MAFNVEKDWTTEAGLRAVVIMTDRGHRCGYVAIPKEHRLYGVDYSSFDFDIEVHGGVTFSSGDESYPVPHEGMWWVGYDCAHAWDRPSNEHLEQQRLKYPDKPYMWDDRADGIHRELAYCERECEQLAAQLANAPQPPSSKVLAALEYAREWIVEAGERKHLPNGGTLARIDEAIAIAKATDGAQ